MTETEFLEHVLRRLRNVDIPFMIVGSVASSYHGEPRLSYDVDIVVDATLDQLLGFVRSFDPPFYVSEPAARQAFARRGMLNVIHPACEFKADIILRKDRDFDRSEFPRRTPACIWGMDAHVATPEDTVLSKLEWGKRSGSERQFRDAVMVAVARHGDLDTNYLARWASDLGIEDDLARALAAADQEIARQGHRESEGDVG